MNPKLLNLKPKKFLCPYCGERHEWMNNKFKYYDSEFHMSFHICKKAYQRQDGGNFGRYNLFFKKGYCYYWVDPHCSHANLKLTGKVSIESIKESKEEPLAYFKVPFRAKYEILRSQYACCVCKANNNCNLLDLSKKSDDHQNMIITLGFEFDSKEYEKITGIKLDK